MHKELELISCVFCNSNEYSLFDTINTWKIVKCSNCGHIYTNPRPKLEHLAELYNEKYYSNKNRFNGVFSEEYTSPLTYDKNIIDIEEWFTQRGALLEIGCARGDFLKIMQNRGWKVQGIDISESSINKGIQKNKINLKCGTIESISFKTQFDAIAMYQCLEHMPNAKLAIDKCHDLLNTNGILVIEVPNLKSFDFKINKERRFWSYDVPFHLSHFTPPFLSKELKKVGFDILHIDLYYPNFILSFLRLIQLKKTTLKIKSNNISPINNKADSLPLLKKPTSWKLNMINYLSSFFPGWRFTIIARKI